MYVIIISIDSIDLGLGVLILDLLLISFFVTVLHWMVMARDSAAI